MSTTNSSPTRDPRNHPARRFTMPLISHSAVRASALALALLVSPLTQAHDPAEHAKEAAAAQQGPDCSKVDHSKMDMKDPVAQAMMAKCAKQQGNADHAGMDHSKMPKPATKPHDDAHGGH